MAYYIKQGQSSIFLNIKVCENECKIPPITCNSKKIEKIVKKIKKKSINQVVLSKQIKQNDVFVQKLNDYDITIFDGKWLMQYILPEIITYLKEKQKIMQVDEITILANELTEDVKQNIKIFANTYKKIRIVTNHLERFKKVEQELYEEKGISIIITNNKRKALSKSMLIINFDFVQEAINQYNINEQAVIINLNDKIKINKKRFSGLIITDYEVEFQNIDDEFLEEIMQKQNEFSLKEILEEKIYSSLQVIPNYNIFDKVKIPLKKYDIQIKELYGINGLIT